MVPHDEQMPVTSQWGHGGEAKCQCSTGCSDGGPGRLSDDEYCALGTALQRATDEQVWPAAIPAATRFLALTGWRSGEALGLRWKEIDLRPPHGDARRYQDGAQRAPALAGGVRRAADNLALGR
jgi:hypothetical protein